ncbi:hypothetical protein SD70_19985 [Gordoniibacillus kamchatkensis]|uniref:DUF975 family protein n=2 Tax=Gordoniibacillus kamchatkensis TaxID=1590651 RepID=A0ABR5AEM5_9BACL|nr:hypothetical protein SD70_19985 [Paenibacillus sp. VKM B-2647]
MWTRAELKSRAKAVLKVSYWKAFLASLAVLFAGGSAKGAPFNFNFRTGGGGAPSGISGGGGIDWNGLLPVFIIIFAVILVLALLFALAFRIFLGFPLEVSGRRYFKQAATDGADLNHLGYAFNKTTYWLVIKAMLLRGVYNFLWYLLLIVPGIVKAYSYSMVPYILADNPHIGKERAIELSRRMTFGHKWNMFVLDLSFLGWYLLGLLALGVGVLFVLPYVNATQAELYLVLRRQALEQGLCTHEELRLT